MAGAISTKTAKFLTHIRVYPNNGDIYMIVSLANSGMQVGTHLDRGILHANVSLNSFIAFRGTHKA